MTQNTLKRKLFPYSLIGKAEQRYTYTVGSMSDNWDELRDKFCLEFFPYPVSLLYKGTSTIFIKMRRNP
jgi:hypothetical protein